MLTPACDEIVVRTLGRFEVSVDGRILPSPPGRGARLLKLLLCSRGHSLQKEYIAETLWPDSPGAMTSLHAAAHDLRRWLGEARGLRFEGEVYILAMGDLDADRFEAEIAQARFVRRIDPHQVIRHYELALSLYDGPFLPDELRLDCVIHRRVQLEALFSEAAMSVAQAALAEGDCDEALQLAGRVSDLDDTREDAARLQMRALAGLGRRPEALRRFKRLRLALSRELDCLPDMATRVLRDQIASGIGTDPSPRRLEA